MRAGLPCSVAQVSRPAVSQVSDLQGCATTTQRGSSPARAILPAVRLLEEFIHHNAHHAERALVFQTLSGLIQLLQRQLGILVELFIVDDFAD